MARDYPSRQNSRRAGSTAKNKNQRQPTRPKPAARSTRARQAKKSGPPGWLWLVCGLCIGLTIAAGFYIFARPGGSGARQRIDIATPAAADSAADATARTPDHAAADLSAKAADSDSPARPKARFSFYKMLPNYEVSVPPTSDAGSSGAGHGPPPHASQDKAPAKAAPAHGRVESGDYVIQAGSFSTHADADRRKAELALLGVSAEITNVDLASGKTVYRVHSDTIRSDDKLDRLVKRLRNNQIDTLVTHAK